MAGYQLSSLRNFVFSLVPPGIFRDSTSIRLWLKLNSVAVVRKRTTPTERPPLVGEVRKRSGTGRTEIKKKKHWKSVTGLRQAKGLILGPSASRTKDLLKLNRDQLRWIVGLLTGHCHLKGHLFKLGLTDDPICERCLKEDESATHILCDCEAVAHLRSRHLGQFFMEPSDYYDAPICRVLHFIPGVGLIKG
jgi:hypothetical protein